MRMFDKKGLEDLRTEKRFPKIQIRRHRINKRKSFLQTLIYFVLTLTEKFISRRISNSPAEPASKFLRRSFKESIADRIRK